MLDRTQPNRRTVPDPTQATPYPDRTQLAAMPQAYYPDDMPTVPAEAVYDRPRRRRRAQGRPRGGFTPKAIAVGSIAGLSVITLLAVMIIFGAYMYFQVFELIVPGVHVGDVKLGGMTREEAAAELTQAWGSGQGVILSAEGQNWVASPADFGMTLEPRTTAQLAFDVGHGGPIFGEFSALVESTMGGTAVAPSVGFDEATARAGLEQWAQRINKVPVDASIQIENGQISAVPGQQGYNLNIDATLAVISADPAVAIQGGYLPLVLDPVAPRIADASGAVAEAEALLDGPLEVRAYDAIIDETLTFTAEPQIIASWLGVQTDSTGPHAVVQPERLTAWIDQQNAGLIDGSKLDAADSAPEIEAALREGRAATLIMKHTKTTYVVEAGDNLTRIAWKVGIPYWRIANENPEVNENGLYIGQVLTIPSKDDLLPLPVVAHKRIIISISEQHLWAYENGAEVYSFVISTGIDRSPTQPGVFQVQEHNKSVYAAQWDLTMPNFMSIYEAWPGFFNGTHGLPTLSSGQILWREVLGEPASYGCIILDLDDGETLYNWAEDGVVVEIRE
jgi:LysM repeat protein